MRGWRKPDLAPWAAMNADPEVRRYLGPPLTFEQAAAWVLNYQDKLDRYGYGFWAVEVRASGEFIGFTGLDTVGMAHDPAEDFDDPDVDEALLRRYVVYRKQRDPET